MARNYTVNTHIARPVEDVYDAVVSSDRLNRYFTNQSSGDLKEGDRVTWHWDDWGDHPVTVRKVEPNRRIELVLDSNEWHKTTGRSYDVVVTLEFEALDNGGTRLSISEAGWMTDAEGLKGSHDNCSGWTHMAMCLKAYLEHGLDLR
jgi:uncharacterized protein YndB with AHSA1/START domain